MLISFCIMLKAGRLHIIACCAILIFFFFYYLKITSDGQKYGVL